jgi:predicted Zn-dependent protease
MTESTDPSKKKKKRILRYLLLAGGLLIALAVSGVFFVYAVKNARQNERYRKALAVYERGEYAEAEKLLINYLREDRNQENAWVKLAELYGKQKRWRQAARCWRFASSLNSLNEQYSRAYLEALLRTRSFREVAEAIDRLPEAEKKQFRPTLCLAYLMGGQLDKAKPLLAALPAADDDVRVRWGRFAADHMAQWAVGKGLASPQLAEFARSGDEVVALEALIRLLQGVTAEQKMAEAEQYLKRMTEINPGFALPLLGSFYDQAGRDEDAARAYREAVNFGLPLDAVFRYADVLFFLNKIDDLKRLAPTFQQGDRETMLCGFYIEALIAYMEKNTEALGKNLKQLDPSVQSPLAVVMRFDYALLAADLPMLQAALKEIVSRPDLRGFYPAAYEKLQPLLLKFYTERKIAEAAPLARLVYPAHGDNLLLARIIFLNQGVTDSVLLGELNAALQRFPEDPVLLTVAVDYRLQKGEFELALPLARKNVAVGNTSVYPMLQEVMALDGCGRDDEARKIYTELRRKYPDDGEILKRYLAFCLLRNRPLPELGDRPEFQALRPLLEGEQAFRAKQPAGMIEAFSSPALLQALNPASPEDQPLLFHMALRLGEADALKPAIAIYEKLKPLVANPMLVELNLAELYAAAGDKSAALREARAAWLGCGTVPAVQGCYGLRMAEAGNDVDALKQLGPLVAAKYGDPRIFPAWVKVLEKLIAGSYQAGRYEECVGYCAQLRRAAPDNPTARDYEARAQAAMARGKGR